MEIKEALTSMRKSSTLNLKHVAHLKMTQHERILKTYVEFVRYSDFDINRLL